MMLTVFFLEQCVNKEAKKKEGLLEKKFQQYAGSASCKSCHQTIYEDHLQTFHHRTSVLANAETIMGVNDSTSNRFYFDPLTYLVIEKTDSGYYQTAYRNGMKKISRRFDLAIGSGKRGQTFLYWYKNYLFQLPLTYFTATHEWTNSPGYSNKIEFNRPVTSRCLECHSTYFQITNSTDFALNTFSKNNFILGVECEKCHGPAAAHVEYHQKNPNDSIPHFIINPDKLSRKQNLDFCRSCHGGRLTATAPAFSFENGKKLSEYFKIDTTTVSVSDIDVHGNQYGMLSASKCFINSNMTCITCHNVHVNENNKNVFAERCMTCHSGVLAKVCKLTLKTSSAFLKSNCIDCHMPELPSKAIMVLRQGESIPTSATMRTHFITIYPDEAKKFLSVKH